VRAGTSEFIRQGFFLSHKTPENSTTSPDEQLAQLDADAARFEGGGVTTCFISVDSRYVSCITARDSLRPEAAEAVASLRSLGITPAMLTGDNASVARAIGTAAGIELRHIHAALLPQDKLDLVSAYNVDLFQTYNGDVSGVSSGFVYHFNKIFKQTLNIVCFWRMWSKNTQKKQPKIRVAHVGDGVNDAPALAAADVGIAMGVAGAAAALEAGDVALFTNDLRVVPALQRLARSAGNKIIFNITLSVVTKVIVLVLAALGKFTLFGAVLVDVGTALLVTLNGLTLLRWDFGLGASAAGCVGAAAAAAAAADGHGCCSNKGCCPTTDKAVGKACCDDGAEEAQQSLCCGHDHGHHHKHHQHHHDHSHKDHSHDKKKDHDHQHSHSHSHGSGGCCSGHDHKHEKHEHSHHNHHNEGHEHTHTHTHSHTSTKSCCSGHAHH
jgi:Cd2+/Zn2+-exporting ATPase